MGSRLTNTSWCWSPRDRAPEHTPTGRSPWKSCEEVYAEKRAAAAAENWRMRHSVGKVYDHNSYNETWIGRGPSAQEVV
jgi:hypothetical protein